MTEQTRSRRGLLAGAATSLSVAGTLALFDRPSSAAPSRTKDASAEQDVRLLNAALSLEDEGIAAYQIGAESKLLATDVLRVAVTFQEHHKRHREDLVAAVRRLGGTPVTAKLLSEYASDLGAASLKNQTQVLRLALKLERGAANAYLGLIPSLGQSDLHVLVARTAADESFHAGVLGHVLGEPIPRKAPLFG